MHAWRQLLAASIFPRPSQDEPSVNVGIAKPRAVLTRFGIIKDRVRCAMRARTTPVRTLAARPGASFPRARRRNPMFGTAHAHIEPGRLKTESVQLSGIGNLHGRKGRHALDAPSRAGGTNLNEPLPARLLCAGRHVLLGLLTEADAGTILLSDEDGSIPLDLSREAPQSPVSLSS
jgi:hypothetical protein